MDNEIRQKIIELNRKLGLKTEFVTAEEGVLGYAENKTIYINEGVEQDYERTNKHEVLHFFEDTPEFKELKQTIMSSIDKRLEQIRAEYELRYSGIYSEDEIRAGVLDNEIVIDILVDNSIIEYENGLAVGDRLLGNIEKGLEERRYLNMSIRRNVQNMNLSDWEKVFVENYYDGKEHIFPQADKSRGIKREDAIRQDIETYLEQLYAMSEKDFIIDPHSPEVIKEYESEIKAMQARGEDTSSFEYDKESQLQFIANHHSEHLYAEYRHIVDQMKGMDFEPAFKAMMLRETLTKTYKLERDEEEQKTIVKKRDIHKSIAGHMILNSETLSFIYEHANSLKEYSNFANLYFAAMEVFNKTIAEKSEISLEDVDTYGMGQWMKFDGKQSNPEEYLENAERLVALVKDTEWCTKTLASSQLAEGDFYVFVDNEGKTHIAVRMTGNQIAEVRGIENGGLQELEEDYRDIAISFLENNQEIKNGIEWLENEEWNKRLVEYRKKIEKGNFYKEDIPQMVRDICRVGYRSNGTENTNKTKLIKSLGMIKDKIAEYYDCTEDEILVADYTYNFQKNSPYKIVIGNVDFHNSEIQLSDFDNIKIIFGHSYGLSDILIDNCRTDEIKSYIARGQLLGINARQMKELIVATTDSEFIKDCIKRKDEFGIEGDDLRDLIIATGDSQYIKGCIENREELGLNRYDLLALIKETKDAEYIEECIDKRDELGIGNTGIYPLIRSTEDDEYIISLLEGKRNIGREVDKLSLLLYISNTEYIKDCIERRNEIGLYVNKIALVRLLQKIDDSEYIKSVIERREEFQIDGDELIELIELVKDSEYIKSVIERREEFQITRDDLIRLIEATDDTEYMKDFIDGRGEVTIGAREQVRLIKATHESEYIKYWIEVIKGIKLEDYKLTVQDIIDLVCATEDLEYIEGWIDNVKKDIESQKGEYTSRQLDDLIRTKRQVKDKKKKERTQFKKHGEEEVAQFADSEASIEAERAIKEAEREDEQSDKKGEEK